MKFLTHHYRKIYRFLHDKITSLTHREIKAVELEEFCEMVCPSFGRFIKDMEAQNVGFETPEMQQLFKLFITNREDFIKAVDEYASRPFGFKKDIDFSWVREKSIDEIQKWIDERKLTRHINIGLDSHAVSSIEIKNLKILGKFSADFHQLRRLIFQNNVFCEDVFIISKRFGKFSEPVYDRHETMFSKNTFYGAFKFAFFGIPHLAFNRNNFHNDMSVISHTAKIENVLYDDDFNLKVKTSVKFVGNKFDGCIFLLEQRRAHITHGIRFIRDVEFSGGNKIREFALSHSIFDMPSMIGAAKMAINVSFAIEEHVALPDNYSDALRLKGFFVMLKRQAAERSDRLSEFNYARKERWFDRALTPHRQDKFILWWSHIISNSGISWIRPLGILLAFQGMFAAIPTVVLCQNISFGLAVFTEFLNPFGNIPADSLLRKSSDSPWIPALILIQKIVLAIFGYEIIKVLRRFSR